MKLSLTFIASRSAAGAEGQGLEPGTCAWVDRPVTADEPRQVRFSPAFGDSTPERTVRDSSVYWSFLAYNSDSGHFTGVGHRHWDAASPPTPIPYLPHASPPPTNSRLTFNPRHLHWYILAGGFGWAVIAWLPMLTLTGLWSGWRRLAGLYPDRNMDRGGPFRCGPVVMGMANYRGGVRLTPGHSHLHFSVWAVLRLGHPPFSVPWSDITASRDQWPWFPFKGKPVIRLTLARYRSLRILVPVSDGERVVAASGGRLHLSEPATPARMPSRCFGLLLLLGVAIERAEAQQAALPLPLTTGATLVQTLTFEGGDRESVHQVTLASPEGLRFEWNLTEAHATGDTIRQVLRYLEASDDLAGTHRLKLFHDPKQPEAHPGYTMHALSRAVFRRLRSGVADSFQVMTVERSAGTGLAAFGFRSNREVPVRWRGTLTAVGPGTTPFPVLVNGQRVEVPAIRVRGSFTARQGRWEPEFFVLADSTYPLILKWTGAFREPGNVVQTVRIDVPARIDSSSGAGNAEGELERRLEGTLAKACRVELPGIYFDFNSADLNPASDRAIASLAGILSRHPDWTATLEGHTDSIGSQASNLALSQRRVESVRRRLIEEHKVDPARLKTAGIGSARPRESNATVEGRARNRRVELVREC